MSSKLGERDDQQLVHVVAAEMVERYGRDAAARIRHQIEQAQERADELSVGAWQDVGDIVAMLLGDRLTSTGLLARSSRPAVTGTKGKATVLVVDDDPDVLEALVHVLERDGHNILKANSGVAALRAIKDCESLDVLLTDVVMPDLDGLDLAEMAKKRLPSLKVLYLTGYAERLATSAGSRPSLGKVLQKPIVPDDLRDEVAALVS
jgi:CheY-like chemotaxis protein